MGNDGAEVVLTQAWAARRRRTHSRQALGGQIAEGGTEGSPCGTPLGSLSREATLQGMPSRSLYQGPVTLLPDSGRFQPLPGVLG